MERKLKKRLYEWAEMYFFKLSTSDLKVSQWRGWTTEYFNLSALGEFGAKVAPSTHHVITNMISPSVADEIFKKFDPYQRKTYRAQNLPVKPCGVSELAGWRDVSFRRPTHGDVTSTPACPHSVLIHFMSGVDSCVLLSQWMLLYFPNSKL